MNPVPQPAPGEVRSNSSAGSAHAPSEDPLLAELHACMQETSEDDRQRKFLDLLQRLKPGDALAVRDVLYRHRGTGNHLESLAAAFYRRWAEIDAAEVLSFLNAQLEAQPNAPFISRRFEQIFEGWATKDPNRAREWLNANSEHPRFDNAFLGFLEGSARVDSLRATQLLLSSLAPEDPLFPEAVKRVSEQVFQRSSAEGVRNWFALLPETGAGSAAKKAAAEAVYRQLADFDLATAAHWVHQQASRPWRSNSAIGNLAWRYAETDPAAAMEWVQTLPPNPASKNGTLIGVGEVVKQWTRKDLSAFEAWLSAHHGTQAFEQAARDYALLLVRKDKEKALYWANQVTNEALRAEALKAAGQ
ncbi:MAG: hypothetical protein M3463_08340 [Verrucomicrobiota bacterium]|nr:hypothetical protein [Verrucomicrobiota bacterium]